MNTFMKADVFFVVSTLAVIVVTVCLVWLLVYIIGIVRDIKKLSKKAEEEGERIIDDLSVLRQSVKKGSMMVPDFVKYLLKSIFSFSKTGKKKINN